MDFNTWVQKASAKLLVSYENDLRDEISESTDKKRRRIVFHCFMSIKFEEPREELLLLQVINGGGAGGGEPTMIPQLSHFNAEKLKRLVHDNIVIEASAVAANKKDAKKRAFENLFIEIASRNLLCLGIRYKSYLDYVLTFQDVPLSGEHFHKALKQETTKQKLATGEKDSSELAQDKINNKLHKISKKIQAACGKDK